MSLTVFETNSETTCKMFFFSKIWFWFLKMIFLFWTLSDFALRVLFKQLQQGKQWQGVPNLICKDNQLERKLIIIITDRTILKLIFSSYYLWIVFEDFSIIVSVIEKSTKASCLFTDSFVNSQEWTLSRAVPDLRLGIVGSLSSGKSALVHRYLTGSYMQEESPEGGRFKKEILVENQSYLLLIRDEGGPPELQVSLLLYTGISK